MGVSTLLFDSSFTVDSRFNVNVVGSCIQANRTSFDSLSFESDPQKFQRVSSLNLYMLATYDYLITSWLKDKNCDGCFC